MKNRKWLLAIFLLIIIFAVVGCGTTTEAPKYTKEKPLVLKFCIDNALTHPKGVAVTKFAELVSQKSAGTIKVEVYPSAQLYNETEAIQAIQSGVVHFSTPYSGKMSGHIPALQIFGFPFVFDNAADFYKFADSELGKSVLKKLNTIDLEALAVWDQGFFQYINSKRPLTKLEDFKGLQFRIPGGKISEKTMAAIGAVAVTLPASEVYTALQQKTVDGIENSLPNIKSFKWYEVAKYLTVSNHAGADNIVITNKTWWEGLSPDIKTILQDSMKEATVVARKASADFAKESLDFLKSSPGIETNELSTDEIKKFREKLIPVYKEFESVIGKDVLDSVLAKKY